MTQLQVAEQYINFAQELAGMAIAAINDFHAQRRLTMKEDGSPVTDLDMSLEQQLSDRIKQRFPQHGIIGEEHGPHNADADWVWILDPIDGTRQFAAGLPNYGSLIALTWQHQPVIGVIVHPPSGSVCLGVTGRQTLLNGTPIATDHARSLEDAIVCLSDPDSFDQRTQQGYKAVQAASRWNVYDGGCIGHVALASGKLSVSLSGPNLEPFDIAALIPVVVGAGGIITDWTGEALDSRSFGEIVATSNPRLHEHVLGLLN